MNWLTGWGFAIAFVYALACTVAVVVAMFKHKAGSSQAQVAWLQIGQGEARQISQGYKLLGRLGLYGALSLIVIGFMTFVPDVVDPLICVALWGYGTGAVVYAYGLLISLADSCPNCRRKVWFRSEDLGKTLTCRKCGARWTTIFEEPLDQQ